MNKSLVAFCTAMALAACQAEVVEFSLKESDLRDVAAGEGKLVSFEATFSSIGDLDDEQRTQVKALEDILEEYVELDDFELKTTDMGFEVIVSGDIAMIPTQNAQDAYFISVTPSEKLSGYYLAQIQTGTNFERMSQQMQAINFMLAPDPFHPTEFRIKADALEVMAPAVEIDGEAHLIWHNVISERMRLSFKDGAFDKTGAGFFFK